MRLYRKLRQGHVRQIAGKLRTPGPQRVMDFWSAPGPGAGQVLIDRVSFYAAYDIATETWDPILAGLRAGRV